MAWRNTKLEYGSVSKWLHWIIAILFLLAYCAVYYRHTFTTKGTPANMTALHLHLSFGITIAVFVILRVFWWLTNPSPALEPGPAWQRVSARSVHYLLYFFMIAMPLTGYLGTGVSANYFFLFEIPKFEDTALFGWLVFEKMGLEFKQFEKPLDFFHKEVGGELVVWLLIIIHAGAGLYHHYVKKDNTLRRMLPKKD